MSKKLIALLLSAALCGTLLASCTTTNDGDSEDTSADTTVETPADTDAPAAELSISEIADEITNQYGDLYDPTNEFSMPLLSYYANFAAEEFNLVFPGIENPEADLGMPISEYITTDLSLYSLESAWIDEIAVKKAVMMTNVDTLLIVKPSAGNEENVLSTLTAYADMQKNDTWAYPQNLPKLQAIQCYEKGGYVFCYVLGTISDDLVYGEGEYAGLTEEELEQAKLDAFAAENKKATDVINSFLGE